MAAVLQPSEVGGRSPTCRGEALGGVARGMLQFRSRGRGGVRCRRGGDTRGDCSVPGALMLHVLSALHDPHPNLLCHQRSGGHLHSYQCHWIHVVYSCYVNWWHMSEWGPFSLLPYQVCQ